MSNQLQQTEKAVMFDMDIPINSKTLYALLCSHLGSGTFVFPKRETILNYLNLSNPQFADMVDKMQNFY